VHPKKHPDVVSRLQQVDQVSNTSDYRLLVRAVSKHEGISTCCCWKAAGRTEQPVPNATTSRRLPTGKTTIFWMKKRVVQEEVIWRLMGIAGVPHCS